MVILVIAMWSANGMTWGYFDFESGTLDGTTMLDVDGDGNNWEISPSTKGGSYIVKSESGAFTPNNWLISSQMMEVERYSSTVYPHIKFMVGGNQMALDYGGPYRPEFEEKMKDMAYRNNAFNLDSRVLP